VAARGAQELLISISGTLIRNGGLATRMTPITHVHMPYRRRLNCFNLIPRLLDRINLTMIAIDITKVPSASTHSVRIKANAKRVTTTTKKPMTMKGLYHRRLLV
jgi:hypothetical protein